MITTTTEVTTPDGRTLTVASAGDPAGQPVFKLHGTPGSRVLDETSRRDAEERGIRLITYDRPGYGGSTPLPGRTVADGAADVRAIAEALGLERIGVWGISGGGPHALACAALLPDLAVAVASLASSAPFGVDGLDYFAGMGERNVEDIQLYLDDPAAARAKSRTDREEMLDARPDELFELLTSLLSPVDAAVFTAATAEFLCASYAVGLAPGDEGWWDDGVAEMAPWGFDLGDVRAPLQLWHGRHDQFVPFGHGVWLAEHIPGVDARLTDVDGHLTLGVNRVPEVHAWMLQHF